MEYNKKNVELVTQIILDNMDEGDMAEMIFDLVESGMSNNINAFEDEVELLIERGLLEESVDKT